MAQGIPESEGPGRNGGEGEPNGPESPKRPSRSRSGGGGKKKSGSDSTFAQVVGIAACVLAALQLVPAYAVPQSQWGLYGAGAIFIGVMVFLFLQLRDPERAERRRFLWLLALMSVVVVASGFHEYGLQSQILKLEQERDDRAKKEVNFGVLQTYLKAVKDEGAKKWDGKFEAKYARPTLYLMNTHGNEQSPVKMQEQLLLWRTGNAGIGSEFQGVAGLVLGELSSPSSFMETANGQDLHEVAKVMVDSVDRPLDGSDLLNKPVAGKNGEVAKEDIPTHVLVLGDPAVGKSTLLDRLDLVQARRALGSLDEPVPVKISLSGMEAPTKESLLAKLRERLGAAADDTIGQRKLIVMMDSLDEAVDPIATARAIAAFCAEHDNDCLRIIVTARLRNYDQLLHDTPDALFHDPSKFRTVIMYGLDQTAVEKQILTDPDTAPSVRKALLERLAESKSRSAWLQFLRLPMNYGLVSEVMEDSKNEVLPRGQAQLIEKFVEKRFKQKEISEADTEHCKELLTRIAKGVLARGIDKRSKAFSLEEIFGEKQARVVVPDARLKQLLLSGIIRGQPGQYRFFHGILLDYFIARGLESVESVPSKDVVNWRYVFLFWSGMGHAHEVLQHLERCRAEAPNDVDPGLIKEVSRIAESPEGGGVQTK